MPAITGDFIGFTFGGKSSRELGIVRVSDGSRYKHALLPNFSDKTISVPGANKTIYLGTEYTGKNFPLSIAFDSVTEQQIRQMQTLFSTTKPLPLVFEETPYKTYYAKAASAPQLSYICFDDNNGQRVYKGEGTIDLVSYFPYGFCNPRELSDVFSKSNVNEWLAASGLEILKTFPLDSYEVYNPGDFDMPFWATISLVSANRNYLPAERIELGDKYLEWDQSEPTNDHYIMLDGRTRLIEGYDVDKKKTGNIYNKYIIGGDWFDIKPGLNKQLITVKKKSLNNIHSNILYI